MMLTSLIKYQEMPQYPPRRLLLLSKRLIIIVITIIIMGITIIIAGGTVVHLPKIRGEDPHPLKECLSCLNLRSHLEKEQQMSQCW